MFPKAICVLWDRYIALIKRENSEGTAFMKYLYLYKYVFYIPQLQSIKKFSFLLFLLLTEKGTGKGVCRNAEMQNYKNIKQKQKNTVFKTRHLRNQKQMVIILKTFTYFIHFMCAY